MSRWLHRLAPNCLVLTAVLTFVVSFLAVVAAPREAAASEKVVAQIDALNGKALAAYRGRKAQTARRYLVGALVIAEDSGITGHRAVARTYVNLGAVHLALRQPREAMNCFALAYQIAPDVRPPRALATAKVRRTMLAVHRRMQRTRPPAPPPALAAEAPEPVAQAKPKEELDPVSEPVPTEDPAGRTLAAASATEATETTTETTETTEATEATETTETTTEDPPGLAGEDAQLAAAAPSTQRGAGSFWIGLGLGTGVGATGSRPLEHHTNRVVKAGPLFGGLLHVMPELGYQIRPGLAVSLQSRHQYIRPSGGPDATVVGPPPRTAHAVLASVYYQLWERESMQLVGTAAIGGGSGFRLKVAPVPRAMLNSSDTVDGGPLVFGPGAALLIRAGSHLTLSPAVRVLVGAPNLLAVAEASFGVQYGF